MFWIAQTERDTYLAALAKRLGDAVDPFRTASRLKSQQYAASSLGCIFLSFADVRLPRLHEPAVKPYGRRLLLQEQCL